MVRPSELSVEDLKMMIDDLQDQEPLRQPEGYEEDEYPLPTREEDEFEFTPQSYEDFADELEGMYSERELAELEPSAEEEEYERMPKRMGMGRGASLDETYIDNMKEGLEEAPPPHDPEERAALGLKPLPKNPPKEEETGPFGEPLQGGPKFPRAGLEANPGLIEALVRSIVREVLAEKKAKTYKGKSMRLGGGGRFAKFVDSLKKSGKSEEQARAIAYKAGAKKYGKEKMKKMAAAGRKRNKD